VKGLEEWTMSKYRKKPDILTGVVTVSGKQEA